MSPEEQAARFAKLAEWDAQRQKVAGFKEDIDKEMTLRKEVAAMFFPTPTEGVNTVELHGGWNFKYTHSFERKVDDVAVEAFQKTTVGSVLPQLLAAGYTQEQLAAHDPAALVVTALNINPGKLVRQKPELETKVYKTLTAEQRNVFDLCLTVKPSSPKLELVAPKPTAAQQAVGLGS